VDFTDGLLAHDLDDAALKRAGLDSSARVIVAASAAKWQAHARVLIGALDQVDVIVTDRKFSGPEQAQLDKYSVEVVNV
jgi:DeoR/GlpR family transcriptional regulator of sugar metabolism